MISAAFLLTIFVICLAGFAQGLTGFGFGLVAISLLPLLMHFKEAASLISVFNLVVTGMTFYSIRSHFSWRLGWGLVVGVVIGLPIGVFALVRLQEVTLFRLLGTAMILFSLNELLAARVKTIRFPTWTGVPFGMMSGGLSGAFGVGGPPLIAYTYSQPWTKEQTVAVLQVTFGLGGLLRLLFLSRVGLVDRPMLIIGVWSFLPLIAAVMLGQKLFAQVPQAILKQITFLFLGVMGIKYLLFP